MLGLQGIFLVCYLCALGYCLILCLPITFLFIIIWLFISRVLKHKKCRRHLFSQLRNTGSRSGLETFCYNVFYFCVEMCIKTCIKLQKLLSAQLCWDRNKHLWSSHGPHIFIFIHLTDTKVYSFLLKCI